MSYASAPISTVQQRNEKIVVIDDNERFLSTCRRWLRTGGFYRVECARDKVSAYKKVTSFKPDLLLVDIHLNKEYDGLDLLRMLRDRGYNNHAVVVSGDSSKEQCFRAAKAGANDFLLKRPHVNIPKEVARVLDQTVETPGMIRRAQLSNLGYLRSFGLTTREIDVLENYTIDYCSQRELAKRVDKAPSQIRKLFSRIYIKLGINSLAQLIHILTSCTLFNDRA